MADPKVGIRKFLQLVALASLLGAMALATGCDRNAAAESPAAPTEVAAEGSAHEGAHVSSFAIEGMHCGSCANSIRTTVEAMDGVEAVALTYDEAVLAVTWAAGTAPDDEAIIAAVTDLGYTATAE